LENKKTKKMQKYFDKNLIFSWAIIVVVENIRSVQW